MADLLLEPLPTACRSRAIDPDFRPMIWLANAYARGEPDKQPVLFAVEQCKRFYKEPIPSADLAEAYQDMLEFYLGGENTAASAGSSSAAPRSAVPAYDYHCDAPYIIAAFQQTYGIDLTTAHIHWWRFKALLQGLPSDCLFCRIINWRTADLAQMTPEMRQVYEEKREQFALPPEVRGGAARAVSLAEHEDTFFARFQQR